MIEHHSFTVEESHLRLDQYLVCKLPDYSRSKIQNLIKLGQVTINGEPAKSSLILHGNESVECHFEPQLKDESVIGEAMDLNIIFEDDYLAVINKPSGLVVHPGSGNWSGTLLNGLVHHFNNLSHIDSLRPGIVHRLDKDTSGLIIIAKTDQAHEFMSEQFAQRKVKKQYLALAWGKLEDKGLIKGEMGRHTRDRKLFTMVESGGRDSSTEYKVEDYYPPLSWVRLFPKTGRTHQLRVHLKSIGHPIFCDDSYGGGAKYAKSFHVKYTQLLNRLLKMVNRVALHAHSLEFSHPSTKELMKFEASIPEDLNRALEILINEK
ncbi:MAG: RluA family pseudouridine synthase [Candidatus Marinimicrobia bacterium]|nr:RluA family pseudouridine synthase [Candidatus Neomarinimicrobiota bacterium]